MRYPAIYAVTFFFGMEGAGIATVTGSVLNLSSDLSLLLFCNIVTFEMSNNILSASSSQLAEVLRTNSLSTMTCLNAALNCWGSGLSLNPLWPLMIENKFSRQSWFNQFVSKYLNPTCCRSSQNGYQTRDWYLPTNYAWYNNILPCLQFGKKSETAFQKWHVATILRKCIFVLVTTSKSGTVEGIKELIKSFYKLSCCTSFIWHLL